MFMICFSGNGASKKTTDLAMILGPVFGVVFLVALVIAIYFCCRSKKEKFDPSLGMRNMNRSGRERV